MRSVTATARLRAASVVARKSNSRGAGREDKIHRHAREIRHCLAELAPNDLYRIPRIQGDELALAKKSHLTGDGDPTVIIALDEAPMRMRMRMQGAEAAAGDSE